LLLKAKIFKTLVLLTSDSNTSTQILQIASTVDDGLIPRRGLLFNPLESNEKHRSLHRENKDRLRHSKFVGLREDKNPKSVVKENKDEA
jgi:hypothetical protein